MMQEGIYIGKKTPQYDASSKSASKRLIENILYRCPCCDAEFTERRVNLHDLEQIGSDSDLRPHYSPVDPILYDVVICRRCGYGSLSKTFDNLSFAKAQIIMSQLPPKYKNMSFPQVYTEDIAINRYKTALLNAMLTREKSGEIAYIYMRLAWIYRAKEEALLETRMLMSSFEGFTEAVKKESFPIIDLDEQTIYYVLGDIAYRLAKKREAEYFFEKAAQSAGVSFAIKNRLKEHPFFKE